MRYLPVTFAGVVAVAACPMVLPAAAQTEPEPAPRTAWGQPDLGASGSTRPAPRSSARSASRAASS